MPTTTSPQRLTVAATIFPLYDITKNIAGPDADVLLILPPGASEHSFEPTTQTIKQLQGTRVLFTIGEFDLWSEQLAKNIDDISLVRVSAGVRLRPSTHSHDEPTSDHANDESVLADAGNDPHYWLDVRNAMIMAQTVATTLAAQDPTHAAGYQSRLREYQSQLVRAHRQIQAILADVSSHDLVTFHDAWQYFAAAYGFTVLATVEPQPGQEPSPADIRLLTQVLDASKTKVIFTEPQLSLEPVRPLLNDHGARLFTLDPLGGVPGRTTYIETMVYNAQTIAEALR